MKIYRSLVLTGRYHEFNPYGIHFALQKIGLFLQVNSLGEEMS